MNKFDKMRRNVARLAAMFGVACPTVSVGSCGYAVNGRYWPQRKHITLDHALRWDHILETTAHEFAHHLCYEWQLQMPNNRGEQDPHAALFYIVLEQVRQAIHPHERWIELAYNVVDKIDKSWR